jgi:hypothetical protein
VCPQFDRAAVGRRRAADQVEQSCLAGAVRPDEAEDLEFGDRERHVLYCADAAEPAGQSSHFENGDSRGKGRVGFDRRIRHDVLVGRSAS